MDQSFNEALLERAKTDPKGVVEVYDRYADRLYAYFVRRCGHRETAEDLTSRVFVQFLKALPTLEWRGLPLEAWLFRTASNALIDHWRRLGTHMEVVPTNEEDEAPWDPPSLQPGPDRNAELVMEGERIREVLSHLSPRDQEVLDLRFFAELEPMEMATILNVSPNHASVLVYRALARLRALYLKTYVSATSSS
jgi:RNA polymerase sigma-70 factor (ECF subfamily)